MEVKFVFVVPRSSEGPVLEVLLFPWRKLMYVRVDPLYVQEMEIYVYQERVEETFKSTMMMGSSRCVIEGLEQRRPKWCVDNWGVIVLVPQG